MERVPRIAAFRKKGVPRMAEFARGHKQGGSQGRLYVAAFGKEAGEFLAGQLEHGNDIGLRNGRPTRRHTVNELLAVHDLRPGGERVVGAFARSEIVAHCSNSQGHMRYKRRPAGLMIERAQLCEGKYPSWAAVVANLDGSSRQVGQRS